MSDPLNSHGKDSEDYRLDADNPDDIIEWDIPDNMEIPQEAVSLHELGREAGQNGDFTVALECFDKAAQIAPQWPYPLYEAAFTYLLKQDYNNALAYYRRVMVLAPRGFFTTQTALHYLEKEQAGTLPPGTYLHYLSCEWTDDPEEKRSIVLSLTKSLPEFAPAWLMLAGYEQDPEMKLQLLERGLHAQPDQDTHGFLQINKALVLAQTGHKKTGLKILKALANDPELPIDIQTMAKHNYNWLIKQNGR